MPINKSILIRLTTIDKCLQNCYRRWTLDDLIEACSDALYEYEGRCESISRRTIQSDLQLLRSEKLGYNAPIIVVDRKYYTYEDKDYSITKLPISSEEFSVLTEAMDVLKHFQMFSQFSAASGLINRLSDYVSSASKDRPTVIDLEKNSRLRGLEYLNLLYDSILNKRALSFHYKSFKSKVVAVVEVSPYLLKEYRNRWFVVCYKHSTERVINCYALDRIESIEALDDDVAYVENTFFDSNTYFDDLIGVSRDLDSKSIRVVLKVDSDQAPYVLTKPLHHSQKLLETKDDGAIVIEIFVIQNLELEREILGFSHHIEVLLPRFLKSRIKKSLNLAYRNYEKSNK